MSKERFGIGCPNLKYEWVPCGRNVMQLECHRCERWKECAYNETWEQYLKRHSK